MTLRRKILKRKLRFFGHFMRRDGLGRTIITGKLLLFVFTSLETRIGKILSAFKSPIFLGIKFKSMLSVDLTTSLKPYPTS
ncbi:Hypothetical predicted protein [Octopus vulgaris]|uniref:Uncharacterized protein n=1 Tax=Octopus vulgaris TaxID=6645 RepID=A0AA36F6Y6_OCTVU|nr:Hypothetical predicted protein [Octopus vulgaris]